MLGEHFYKKVLLHDQRAQRNPPLRPPLGMARVLTGEGAYADGVFASQGNTFRLESDRQVDQIQPLPGHCWHSNHGPQ